MSALKHGITKAQILQVLSDHNVTRYFPLHEDAQSNPQEMAIGYTQKGVLLEIGVRYMDNFDDVFHANRVSSKYRQLYEAP